MTLRFALALVAMGLAIAAETIPCSASTILFLDDEEILYRAGTIRQAVEWKKFDGNPVIAPEKPWEGMIGWTSCYRDAKTGLYQLWYQAYQPNRTEDKSLRCVVCYAESDDGRRWRKPNLRLFPYYEFGETNIVLTGAGGRNGGYGDRYCNSVLVDPQESDPSRKYKMLYYDWHVGEDADRGAGTHVAFSPDGIHWTKHEGMVSKTSYGSKGVQPPFADEGILVKQTLKDGSEKKSWLVPLSMSDAMDAFYDERHGRYIAYGKMWIAGPDGGLHWKHGMGRMESCDFIHWSKPELVLTVDDLDPPHLEFHTSPVFLYNNRYLSFNQILDRGAGTIDIELMSSRDGYRWDRNCRNQPVLPRGVPGAFDAGSMLTNGTPIVLEDEIRCYYGAYRGTAIGGEGLDRQRVGSQDYFSGVGLATTPRDRLMAVRPNPQAPVRGQKKDGPRLVNTIGQVTLRPRELTGVKSIAINADATKGKLLVEILNEDGFRLRGFSREDAIPIVGDHLAAQAKWKEKSLSDLPPGRYQLRIHLDQADLYAVSLP